MKQYFVGFHGREAQEVTLEQYIRAQCRTAKWMMNPIEPGTTGFFGQFTFGYIKNVEEE